MLWCVIINRGRQILVAAVTLAVLCFGVLGGRVLAGGPVGSGSTASTNGSQTATGSNRKRIQ